MSVGRVGSVASSAAASYPPYLAHLAGTCGRCKTENVLLTTAPHWQLGVRICLSCRGELQAADLKAAR